MFNMRAKLGEFQSVNEVAGGGAKTQLAVKEQRKNQHRGRSTVDRNESIGRETVFMSKLGSPVFNNQTASELHKTNPASFLELNQSSIGKNYRSNRNELHQNLSEMP